MTQPELAVDFFERATVEDPYPHYESVRETGRVVWNPLLDGWMVTGFEDCSTVLTDDGRRFVTMNSDLPWFEAPTMISSDGADHRRLRGCLAPAFTRRAVAQWEDRVGEVVDALLEPVRNADRVDLIGEFTRLPTIVVAEMLGVPAEHHDDFERWSNTIVTNLSYGHEDESAASALQTASTELNTYLRDEIDRHRQARPDDLLTTMLDASAGEQMSDDEVRSAAVLLLIAGYDTTAKLLSNTVVTLEQHPDQRAEVAADPSLVPAMLEEVLRWCGTVQAIPRRAVVDTELAGIHVRAGSVVYALIAAANRDPDRWTRPGHFDVHRVPKAHFGFGYGPHLCLGAPLARLESKIAIERLLQIAPAYRSSDVEYGPSFFVRGPARGTLEPFTAVS